MPTIQDSRILSKRSTSAGVLPSIAPSSDHTDGSWSNTDIYKGEIFFNLVDEKAFTRFDSGIVGLITANGSQDFTGDQSFGGYSITYVSGITDGSGLSAIGINSRQLFDSTGATIADFSDAALGFGVVNSIGTHIGRIKNSLPSGDTTYELPATSGTFALLSDIPEHFKGIHVSLVALQTAYPTANPGDYAFVDSGIGADSQQYIWDDDDSDWVASSSSSGVSSFNGRVGVVTPQSGDYTTAQVTESGSLYYTNSRVNTQVATYTGDVTLTGTVYSIGANKVTNAMLAGAIAAAKLIGTDIATVGTITAGVWNAGTVTSSGAVTGTSHVITGTAGAGFYEAIAQSAAPSAPSVAGFRLFAGSTGSLSWIRNDGGTDVFRRTITSTLTANRVYTLQDVAYTIAGVDVANQDFTAVQRFSAASTEIKAVYIYDPISGTYKIGADCIAAGVIRYGAGYTSALSLPTNFTGNVALNAGSFLAGTSGNLYMANGTGGGSGLGTNCVHMFNGTAPSPSAPANRHQYYSSDDAGGVACATFKNEAADVVRLATVSGWGTPTGTLTRTTYATYAGGTASALYTQAELQGVMDAAKVNSERLAALISDLKTVHGLLKT
jgi:hypothetical protein